MEGPVCLVDLLDKFGVVEGHSLLEGSLSSQEVTVSSHFRQARVVLQGPCVVVMMKIIKTIKIIVITIKTIKIIIITIRIIVMTIRTIIIIKTKQN